MDVSEPGDRLRSVVDADEPREPLTIRTLEFSFYPHFSIRNLDLETDALGQTDPGLEDQVSEL